MPELKERILERVGPEATANLSVTCKAAFSLIQRDDRLWRAFADASFGQFRRIQDVDVGHLFNSRSHADHVCFCFYFRYWAARRHTCRHCDLFSGDVATLHKDNRGGVVCHRCHDSIARKELMFDL